MAPVGMEGAVGEGGAWEGEEEGGWLEGDPEGVESQGR